MLVKTVFLFLNLSVKGADGGEGCLDEVSEVHSHCRNPRCPITLVDTILGLHTV